MVVNVETVQQRGRLTEIARMADGSSAVRLFRLFPFVDPLDLIQDRPSAAKEAQDRRRSFHAAPLL
jgi:hypothetical protein